MNVAGTHSSPYRSLTNQRELTCFSVVFPRRSRSGLTCKTILQRDDFPRLIDDIPRRLPKLDFPRLQEGITVGLQEFFLPSNWSDQELLPWRILFAFFVLVAITTELVSVSTRTARSLGEAREKRAQQKKQGAEIGNNLGPEAPDIPRTKSSKERLISDRANFKREIRAERTRGLYWLAGITLVAIWCTGILFKDNALQP